MAVAGDDAEAREVERRARAKEELRVTWRAQSDRTKTREWDLNNPAQRRYERPAREVATGASGMQYFEGERLEDPSIPVRKRAELIESTERLRRQREVRRAADAAAAAADADLERRMLEAAAEAEAERAAAHALELKRTQLENLALARAMKERRERELADEARVKEEEVARQRGSGLLCEDRTLGYAFGAPHRTRKDHFKGFSVRDVEEVRAEQERQRAELAERRRREKEEAERTAAAERAMLEAAAAADAAAAAERAERARQYAADLLSQEREARERRQREERERKSRFDETADGFLAGFGKRLAI